MFKSIREQYNKQSNELAIDIAPLIDVVFILLIFFMVTATFIKDTGIKVDIPKASAGTMVTSHNNLRVTISASGNIYALGDKVTQSELLQLGKRFLYNHPGASVVIITDTNTASGHLVHVLNTVKLSGINEITIATAP